MTAEIKKEKHIYYHCTGYRGRCGEPYVRQEVLESQFEASLRRLHVDQEIFDLIRRASLECRDDEQREREQTVARSRNEADRLQQRIDTLYVDRLDDRVTLDFPDRMAKLWREERARCLRDMEALLGANDGFVDDGVALLSFARDAYQFRPEHVGAETNRSQIAAIELLMGSRKPDRRVQATICDAWKKLPL